MDRFAQIHSFTVVRVEIIAQDSRTQGSSSFVKTVQKWNSTITERSSNNRLWILISVSEIGEKLQHLACFINDSISCGSDPNTLSVELRWMSRVLCFLLLIKRVYFNTLYRRITGHRRPSLSFFLVLSVFILLIPVIYFQSEQLQCHIYQKEIHI